MTVVLVKEKKIPLGPGDIRYDTRETVICIADYTKANSDASIAYDSGLSEVYYANAIGDIAAKPFKYAISGGTVTFDDGGSTSNTTALVIVIGRR